MVLWNVARRSPTLPMSLDAETDVLYTDFSEAFDRLEHDMLLKKSFRHGLSLALNQLFTSYLTGRRQYVMFGVVKSVPSGYFSVAISDNFCSTFWWILQWESLHIEYWCFINKLPWKPKECLVMSFIIRKNRIEYSYKMDNVLLKRPVLIIDLDVIFFVKLWSVSHIEATISAPSKV